MGDHRLSIKSGEIKSAKSPRVMSETAVSRGLCADVGLHMCRCDCVCVAFLHTHKTAQLLYSCRPSERRAGGSVSLQCIYHRTDRPAVPTHCSE